MHENDETELWSVQIGREIWKVLLLRKRVYAISSFGVVEKVVVCIEVRNALVSGIVYSFR